MSTEIKKASTLFNRLLKITLGKYLKHKYHVHCDFNDTLNINPPYMVIGNHVNNYDPFLLSYFVDEPVHFVTSDEQYRNPIKSFLLKNFVGAIPKTKFISDLQTIRTIMKLVRQNCVIGIFPEGNRNWDGTTGEIVPSTAKLIKTLKIPVIVCILDGAHLTHPRWALNDRIGEINLSFKQVLTEEEIKSKNHYEILEIIEKSLIHDEYKQQERNHIFYKGRKKAEKIEQFLFICPNCNGITTLESHGDTLCCNKCKYTVNYTEKGLFHAKDKLIFKNPAQWGQWQNKFLNKLINTTQDSRVEITIYHDKDVRLYTAGKFLPLKRKYTGDLLFTNKRFYFSTDKNFIDFNITKISGLNVQYSNELEFYYNNELFRFKFYSKGVSAYKWVAALNILENMSYNDVSLAIQ